MAFSKEAMGHLKNAKAAKAKAAKHDPDSARFHNAMADHHDAMQKFSKSIGSKHADLHAKLKQHHGAMAKNC